MAYIKVDLVQFNRTADSIDSYIKKTSRHMTAIEETLGSLQATWQGKDYIQISKEWIEINSKNSTTDKMMTILTNYANAIRESGQRYREAQMHAIDRANRLCK